MTTPTLFYYSLFDILACPVRFSFREGISYNLNLTTPTLFITPYLIFRHSPVRFSFREGISYNLNLTTPTLFYYSLFDILACPVRFSCGRGIVVNLCGVRQTFVCRTQHLKMVCKIFSNFQTASGKVYSTSPFLPAALRACPVRRRRRRPSRVFCRHSLSSTACAQ